MVFVGGGLYLIVFIAIGAFVFANLVVAVVVTNLECAVLDVRKEEQENAKELEAKGLIEQEDSTNSAIINDEQIPSYIFWNQEPLFIPVCLAYFASSIASCFASDACFYVVFYIVS